MLWVTTWLWGDKYNWSYVERLGRAIDRNLKQPYRFICIEPKRGTYGCLCRLRMFDPEWQAELGALPDERMVWIDLDTVITGPLDEVFDRPEPVVVLQGLNTTNPCTHNGGLVMVRAGSHPEVRSVPPDWNGTDQDWLAKALPNAAKFGPQHGVYAYGKPGWKTGNKLPANARIVFFVAKQDPANFMNYEWVRDNWI